VDAGYFTDDPFRKCIGSIISIDNLNGVEGISSERILVASAKDGLRHPSYVLEQAKKVKIDGKDGDKVALTEYSQLPLDVDGGKIQLRVAHTKYSTRMAMRQVKERLIDDLIHKRVTILNDEYGESHERVPRLPCQLHCDGIVVTGDKKVILARRGDSRRADIDPLLWATSFGESADWYADVDAAGIVHPLNTVWRGLDEELGMPRRWLESRFGNTAKVTFLELGFQIDSLIYILFSMIELPKVGIEEALDRARKNRKDKEPIAFGQMEFVPDQCASAIVSGKVGDKTLNSAGRFALLLASLNKFETAFHRELARS
jgi:hypothetical protein